MPTKAQPKRRGRPGRIGNEIFELVQSLVTVQKMTRTGAFKHIAEQSGRNEGTVAANYYRIAHQRGVQLQKRRRRGMAAAPAGARRMPTTGRARTSHGRGPSIVQELAELIRRQAHEIEQLRRENRRFQEIRRLVAR